MRRLLIRPGAIGDFIVSLPALEHLRSEYTEVWAAAASLPLARFASRARSIASTGLDLLGLPGVEPPPSLMAALASFDSIVSWYGANRADFRRTVAALGLPFQFHQALPDRAAGVHAADYSLLQVGGVPPAILRLACPAPSRREAVMIHPFSGSPKKNWPLERFRELTRRLAPRVPVRWVAEPGSAAVDGIEWEPPESDLFRLACRLAEARLYIGNDSGITHLAAASGTPVLALFGPGDPAVWGPRGERVDVVSSGGRPVESISLEAALAAAQSLLG